MNADMIKRMMIAILDTQKERKHKNRYPFRDVAMKHVGESAETRAKRLSADKEVRRKARNKRKAQC